MATLATEVAIIGGGIHGVATALNLAARGVDCIVLEKDQVGRHASGVNAGGVRTLGRHIAEIPLALASRRLWAELSEIVGDDCGFKATGQLRIAPTTDDLRRLKHRVRDLRSAGYEHEELIDSRELYRRVPALAPGLAGAVIVETDGYAEPMRTTHAFRRQASALGAKIVEGCAMRTAGWSGDVWTLRLSDGRQVSAPKVVNCAGAWSGRVAAMFGDHLPLSANGSMQMVTERLPSTVTPVISIVGRAISLKQFVNGTVVIGGGRRAPVDLDTNRSGIDLRGIAEAAKAAIAAFPFLKGARLVRAWSGIEGFMPDGLPVIGAGRRTGVFHACGFSAHGFQLGPIVGRIMAELVTSGRTNLPIEPFALGRFERSTSANDMSQPPDQQPTMYSELLAKR